MSGVLISIGDCIESLRHLPDKCVHTCVTSPPYFGLRDYQVDGQIGLEATPDAFVARLVDVFREVRRVLRDDGTLWLNLGDSYASGGRKTRDGDDKLPQRASDSRPADGAKPKDLIGIPWRVAFALQQPYYAGRVKAEIDRVWLAAMLDGEGCFYIHRRLAGQHAGDGYFRQADNYQCAFEIANTSEAIVQRCLDLTGVGSIIRQDKERRQPLFRWTVRSNEAKSLIREVYPYLVAKKQQARIAFGVTASGKDAEPAWLAMKALHSGSTSDVDYPAPPSCHEPGWYLRQDIIWSKPNPMPESVRDRCTKAHEYLFLFSKSPKYYFDAEAIKEPMAESSIPRLRQNVAEQIGTTRANGGAKTNGNFKAAGDVESGLRNRRSVWTVTTKPFKGAHFATFPPDLIEPCVLAGAPEKCCSICGAPWQRERIDTGEPDPSYKGSSFSEGKTAARDGGDRTQEGVRTIKISGDPKPSCNCNADATSSIVLDPFGGSGTTAGVALKHGRRGILCELNPDYVEMMNNRIVSIAGVQPNSISAEARRIGRAFNIWEIC